MILDTLQEEAEIVLGEALGSQEWHIQFAACEAFAHLGESKDDKIWNDALQHSSSFIRDRAVIALGKIKKKSYLASLKKYLNDEDPHVRGHVIESLFAIAPDKVLTFVENGLKDKNDFVKDIAIDCLDSLNTLDSSNILERIAQGEGFFDNYVYPLRLKAAYALAQKRNNIGFTILEETLNSQDIWLEFLAAKKLLTLGNKKGIPKIETVLKLGDWDLKLDALTALLNAKENISEIELLKPVDTPDMKTQVSTAIVLYSLQPEVSDRIIRMALLSNQDDLEMHTIENIVKYQQYELLQYSKEILISGREHVRATIVVAIEKIGSRDLLFLLEPIFYRAHWLLKIQAARAVLKVIQG